MAFENVDTTSLKNALTSCKNSLKSKKIEELASTISSSNWECDAKKNLKSSLDKLAATRYKDLEKKLDDYFNMIPLIEEYKNLDKENLRLKGELINVSNMPNKTKGKSEQLERIKRKIRENKTRMDNLKNRVESLI